MSCDKNKQVPFGEWTNTYINGAHYISVDGVPTYKIDDDFFKLDPIISARGPSKDHAHTFYTYWPSSMIVANEKNNPVKSMDELASHLLEIAEENIERDEQIYDLQRNLHHAECEYEEISARVERLEERIKNKLDKPSVAPELIEAEIYMDDYLSASRRFKSDRHAQKQRINTKLKRISRITQERKMRKTDRTIIYTGAAVLLAGAIMVAVAFVVL